VAGRVVTRLLDAFLLLTALVLLPWAVVLDLWDQIRG
jgi:hypothetical protein